MESLVKRSLRAPIRKLTCCVSGATQRAKHRTKRWNRGRGGGGGGGRGGTRTPRRPGPVKDPSLRRCYQADLERERKLREAMNERKNAERAAMRAQFRKKYQLSKNRKDTAHLRAAGGKVSLPRRLAEMVRPETKTKPKPKDDSFDLLSAFQGLSFNIGLVTGSKQRKTPTPTAAANGTPCKIM